MSLTVSQIITYVNDKHPDEWPSPQIAVSLLSVVCLRDVLDHPTQKTTVAFVCGFIVLGLGLLRIAWIVEFIPLVAVSGFMTGSAINIACKGDTVFFWCSAHVVSPAGQVPGLMGISGFK